MLSRICAKIDIKYIFRTDKSERTRMYQLCSFLTSFLANCDNTYIRVIWWEDWLLLGSVSMMDFKVALFFLVGGGRHITDGELGTKPATSISPKVMAACWHEHVNTTQVRTWTSWSRIDRFLGNSWSMSPSLTGKPFSCISWNQAWSSVSLVTSPSDL